MSLHSNTASARTPLRRYQDKRFFGGFGAPQQPAEVAGDAPGFAALQALLPSLAGARVLDLDGRGQCARQLLAAGAASVTVVGTPSPGAATDGVRYLAAATRPSAGAFDLVLAMPARHPDMDLPALARQLFQALRTNGRVVLALAQAPGAGEPTGWARTGTGWAAHWPVEGDHAAGERHAVSCAVDALIRAGFHRLQQPAGVDAAGRRTPFRLIGAIRL